MLPFQTDFIQLKILISRLSMSAQFDSSFLSVTVCIHLPFQEHLEYF